LKFWRAKGVVESLFRFQHQTTSNHIKQRDLSTRIFSPGAMKNGTMISRPVSRGAGFQFELRGQNCLHRAPPPGSGPGASGLPGTVNALLRMANREQFAMAKVELLFGTDARLRRLAQEIIVTQESEIQLMQKILGESNE
jgi:hypothetical protein